MRILGRRIDLQVLVVTVVVLVVVVFVALLGIVAGSSSLTIPDALRTLLGAGTGAEQLIVFELRLPRVAGALVVGCALGIAGALTQTFARNPLATPDIIGVTSGAAFGAVAVIVFSGGVYAVGAGTLSLGVPLAATLGALITAAIVYGLSWKGGVDSFRLILIGIGATATLMGLIRWFIARAQLVEAATASQWLAGSLSGISWTSVVPVVVVLLIVTPIAMTQTFALEIGRLGDDMSTGLGVALQRHRIIVIACAVVLAAAAVSAAGPIEFIAFVAPQIARRIAGTGRPPLLLSGFMGALVVVGADLIARALLPSPVPVGIITAIVGAPYLIWLLTRRKERETLR
ncbi:iron ABC transporter permease [Naasia lichenicola]|uniref:Iron ABC transporter permease n=1 Tax=Naasia lichenicola TaxID=2565933 RepID=A0A4S4FIQ9_9MICO|nr:iron ABC transporter permease [Naasia lichenicola]